MTDPLSAQLIAKAPKRALVDALRHCGVGPSNLSMQDVGDLRKLARETARSKQADEFIAYLGLEFQRRAEIKPREDLGVAYRDCRILQSGVRSAGRRERLFTITGRFAKTSAAEPFLPTVQVAMEWIDAQHAAGENERC